VTAKVTNTGQRHNEEQQLQHRSCFKAQYRDVRGNRTVQSIWTPSILNTSTQQSTVFNYIADGGGGSAPRPDRFTPGKDPEPTVQEAGWAPGPVGTPRDSTLTVQPVASRYTG
jgi:hypothetical protein